MPAVTVTLAAIGEALIDLLQTAAGRNLRRLQIHLLGESLQSHC